MKRATVLLSLAIGLLLFTPVIFPAQAAPNAQAALPTPTYKACHICDEDLPQPVVHAILFWMDGCSHCHEVLDNVLPPLQEKYGAQLEITLVEVSGLDDVNRLYDIAARYGISRKQVRVPFLIVGNQVLMGSQQIPEKFPGLIENYLAKGGVERPAIPNLNAFLAQSTPTLLPLSTMTGAVVRAVLFTTPDCHSCQIEAEAALEPVQEKFGTQFELRTVDVITSEDVEYLHRVTETYGVSRQEVDLPLIIVGEHVLIGEQMAPKLPELVAGYLAEGGVDWPAIPARAGTVLPATADAEASTTENSNGFSLAILLMVLMAAALVYSLVILWRGVVPSLPTWTDWFIPVLIVIGIGVAGYLSYVETQSAEAMCGPVGDCNAVQQSRYAKLFNILPVGVLGLLGYLGLLAAWLVRRFLPKLEKPAAIGFWGMAFFAVIFSLYLTYLEPFVIKAVCLWCLSSAVIVTLLLLLGTPPAVLQFTFPDEGE
jgi:uncharacterized membrane protein